MATRPENVDEYIATFPPAVREVLEGVRAALHRAIPDAGEKISYQIPTLTRGDRSVVSFAGWKGHVSLYPAPEGDEAFEQAIAPFRAAKSTLKFPLGTPIPYELVERAGALLAGR